VGTVVLSSRAKGVGGAADHLPTFCAEAKDP
jgi:hypothetical protein